MSDIYENTTGLEEVLRMVNDLPGLPVRGVDYWTEADQEFIVQQVISALGTPVFGRVDADNNVILTGELADGTYTVKYEDADGNVTEIGTLIQDADAPTYTNQIPISTDTDGSIFNGTGYQVGKRVSSSGVVSDLANASATNPVFLTGFIPIKSGDVFRFKDCYIDSNDVENNATYGQNGWSLNIAFYDKDKIWMNNTVWTSIATGTYGTGSVDASGICREWTANEKIDTSAYKYVRFCLAGTPETAVITINEPIDEPSDDPDAPTYTNQIPISTDTDGSVFNGTGYQNATRLNSSGEPVAVSNASAETPAFTTGFIPVKKGDVIRMKDCYIDTAEITADASPYGGQTWGFQIGYYNSSKEKNHVDVWTSFASSTKASNFVMESNRYITGFTYEGTDSYMRFTLAGTPETAVITVNEPIDEPIVNPVDYLIGYGNANRVGGDDYRMFYDDLNGQTNYKMIYQKTGDAPLHADNTITTLSDRYPLTVPDGKTMIKVSFPNLGDKKLMMAVHSYELTDGVYTRVASTSFMAEGVYECTFGSNVKYIGVTFRASDYGGLDLHNTDGFTVEWS